MMMAWRGLITSAVEKVKGADGRTIAFAALAAVFVAWATIDSTPKIARLYTAHQNCGTWSGSCPQGTEPPKPPREYKGKAPRAKPYDGFAR